MNNFLESDLFNVIKEYAKYVLIQKGFTDEYGIECMAMHFVSINRIMTSLFCKKTIDGFVVYSIRNTLY